MPDSGVIEWKFKVGDIVRHIAGDFILTKGSGTDKSTGKKVVTRWFGNRAVRFIILERLTQTCHGGTQRHYRCRMVGPEGQVFNVGGNAASLIDLCEFELEAFAPIREEETVEPLT